MTAPAAPAAPEPPQQQPTPDAPPTDGDGAEKDPRVVASLQAIREERDAAIRESKAAKRELEQVKRGNLSAEQQVIADAEARGATTAAEKYQARLVRTEFDAQAGRRDPDADVASVLEFVDLKKFIGEDGEPDIKAIKKAVEKLVPLKSSESTPPPSFDGGIRTPAPTTASMSSLIRQAAGRA